ncbi:hypothetical protein BAQ49_23060 [Bacillus proteolyticus]|uniref:Uncharacterized protein n=1 Tax=Bacillus proteolyticus TaxID=2026192 RepID=A0AA44KZ70_9BACI|nr:hypothetical protein BAQ49_23060 [Bacillus proteolyticus]
MEKKRGQHYVWTYYLTSWIDDSENLFRNSSPSMRSSSTNVLLLFVDVNENTLSCSTMKGCFHFIHSLKLMAMVPEGLYLFFPI